MEALGYRPSGVARSLKLRTTRTIGLLVTDIENPYFPQIVRAVEDAALQHGLAVLLCNAADDPGREQAYLELLAERRVDGIIVASSGLLDRHAARLTGGRPPLVLVNCPAASAATPAVLSDNRTGGLLMAEHVIRLGHTQLGHVSAPARNAAAAERRVGIESAMAQAGLDPGTLRVVEGDGRLGGGEAAAATLLGRWPETTALLCYNDLTAVGALRAARRLGRRVPGDMSVVGFDDIALAAAVDPPLTTVAQDTAAMGRWAVETLLTPAPDESSGRTLLLPVGLRVRGSSGPPPARPA